MLFLLIKKYLFNIPLFFIFFFLSYQSVSFSEEKNVISYKLGKPYKIKGVWYYPKADYRYNEIGIAIIYKDKKNETKTKNGEYYLNNKVSAAHKTLPLPSYVRVTNLINGFSINVRINDRGPFNNLSIIQLSKKAAGILKIDNKGLVEVRIMPVLSRNEKKKLTHDKNKPDSNLEKVDNLKKPDVTSENLMKEIETNLDIKNKSKQKNIKVKNKNNLNFKKNKVHKYYMRIEIATFTSFDKAAELKSKFKRIYNKILLSLDIIDNQKFYKLKTIPLKSIEEAEKILAIIQKNGYKNAKIIIEKKKYEYNY